ncbi:MAG: hypothetical protein WKH64_16300 [Chloroflexia bacterium]
MNCVGGLTAESVQGDAKVRDVAGRALFDTLPEMRPSIRGRARSTSGGGDLEVGDAL